jgi:hypothetical protein
MDRAQQIGRYRHLRAISKEIHAAVIRLVPVSVMLDIGRRLGMTQGRTFMLNSTHEFDLVGDIAVYTSHNGRTRALDRFARQARFESGSDEALMLRSAQNAWFTTWLVQGRHETAGVMIEEQFSRQTLRLMDIGHELSVQPGDVFVGRLQPAEDFVMICGVALPVGPALLEELRNVLPSVNLQDARAAFQNPRTTTAWYKAAVRCELFDRLRLIDPNEPDTALAA